MASLRTRWLWAGILGLLALSLYAVSGILLPFVAGLLIAYFLNPLATRLEGKRLSRGIGAGLLVFLFFVIFVGGLLVALPFLKNELSRLAIMLPSYGQKVYGALSPLVERLLVYKIDPSILSLNQSLHEQLSNVASWALRLAVGLFSNTLALANLLSLIVLTPIIAFYVLRDWPLMMAHLNSLLPPAIGPTVRELAAKINTVLGGYARGQALVCLTLALYYTVVLGIVGLKFSLTIGLIAGLFAFVPYFGFFVAVSAALGVALTQHPGWFMTGCVGVTFLVGQLIESYILVPRLVGDRIGLHPVWIIFALLAAGILFGFIGLLFALPLAGAVGVLVRYGVARYKESTLYQGDGPYIP